ncbi:MAG: hypothetical protein KDD95_02900, partial [Rhodobacteraceae bacterium]|nr:hypothetical protein [Paracoccaceae bacterium]
RFAPSIRARIEAPHSARALSIRPGSTVAAAAAACLPLASPFPLPDAVCPGLAAETGGAGFAGSGRAFGSAGGGAGSSGARKAGSLSGGDAGSGRARGSS